MWFITPGSECASLPSFLFLLPFWYFFPFLSLSYLPSVILPLYPTLVLLIVSFIYSYLLLVLSFPLLSSFSFISFCYSFCPFFPFFLSFLASFLSFFCSLCPFLRPSFHVYDFATLCFVEI